jgi:GNAT superfamily N-acetyltransferase
MWMWVEVQNRRRGIARALLAEIELWGGKLDFSSLHLEVGEHNRIGRQFYAQCGYIPTDARKWLGREEERLIVMCKSLAV